MATASRQQNVATTMSANGWVSRTVILHCFEHPTTATAMYREMGMTYWLEKAEAEIRHL